MSLATAVWRSFVSARKTILLIAGIGALISVPASAALIHQYTFDGGSVATDSVGGANGTGLEQHLCAATPG